MRDSGFGGSLGPPADAFAGSGVGTSVAGAETAAPSGIGPCLSPRSALNSTCPPPASPLRSASAQLCALVCTKGWAVCPLVPPSTGRIERASGYAVMTLKRSVIGWDGYGGVAPGAPPPG